jgi:cytochrome c-type protein NapC
MGPYVRDAEDPGSQSLAAIHSRNNRFGEQSCYVCHADYKSPLQVS